MYSRLPVKPLPPISPPPAPPIAAGGPSASLFGPVLVVSACTIAAGLLNYLMLVVLAARFGAAADMDAYFAAVTIPQLVSAVLTAALTTTFVPLYIDIRSRNAGGAWDLASHALNILLLVLAALAGAGVLGSAAVIGLINPGFDPRTAASAAGLFRWTALSIPFSGAAVVLSALHIAHRAFARPALAQALNSFVVLGSVLATGRALGVGSAAVGMLAGSVLQCLLLLPILSGPGRYRFAAGFRRPEIVRLGALMLPLLAGAAFYRSSTLVERFIASGLGPGRVAWLGYAFKIVTLAHLVLTQGLSTVLLPRLSERSAAGDMAGLRRTLSRSLRIMILAVVPAAFALVAAGGDIVRLIFERGDFTRASTAAVAPALAAYAGYLAAGVLAAPVVNTLYALQRTRLVAGIGMAGFLLYAASAFPLAARFSYPGIAAAVSIQYVLGLAAMWFAASRAVGGIGTRPLLRCLLKAAAATAAAGPAALGVRAVLIGAGMPFGIAFPAAAAAGAVVYGLGLILLRAEDLALLHPPLSRWPSSLDRGSGSRRRRRRASG